MHDALASRYGCNCKEQCSSRRMLPKSKQQPADSKEKKVANAPNPKCIQVVLPPVITSKSTAIYSPSHPQGTMFLFHHLDQQYNLNCVVVLGIEALLC